MEIIILVHVVIVEVLNEIKVKKLKLIFNPIEPHPRKR